MNTCIHWWETEWFDDWEHLALHQAIRTEPGTGQKLRSPASTAPAQAGGDSVEAESRLTDRDEVEVREAPAGGESEQVKAPVEDDPALGLSTSNDGLTPLHLAAGKGRKDVAGLLLANKADVNAKDDNGWTPLHWAAVYDHREVAELLLASNADVNAKDNNGWTPSHWAAGKGRKEVAELLRQHGGCE
jgi:ankyrin repeat protein